MPEKEERIFKDYEIFKSKFSAIIAIISDQPSAVSLKMELGKVWDEVGSFMRNQGERICELEKENEKLHKLADRCLQVEDLSSQFIDDFFSTQKLLKAIHSTYNINSFCNVFIDTLSNYLPLNEFGIYLIEDNKPVLVYPDDISDEFRTEVEIDYEEGIIDWVIKEGYPVVLDDIHKPKHSDNFAFFIAPMLISGKPLGFFKAKTPKKCDEYTPAELEILDFMMSQASLALSNVRLIIDLTSTKDFLQNLMDTADDLIIVFDISGRILFINKAVEKFGHLRESLLDESMIKLIKSRDILEYLLDLTSFPLQEEIELFSSDEASVHTICNISAIRDFEGCIKEFIGVFKDVTTRRCAEFKKIESERLSAVAETAIAINHEMNNPLSIIMGQLYLALDKARKIGDSEIVNKLEIVDRNFRRMINIMKKLQNIQKADSTEYLDELRMIDLNSTSV